MSKHTPGPWGVDVDKHGEVTVYEAVTLKNIDICTMGGNTNDGSNARLIAAAPDLLEALQELEKEFRKTYPIYYYAEPWAHETNVQLQKARAAIAKATGEDA